jgi:putative transposase
MPRPPRIDVAGEMYHVVNRGNDRNILFHTEADYAIFERLFFDKLEDADITCLAYVIMPNHWHLLLKTYEDGALSRFIQILMQAHTQIVRIQTRSIGAGHLYQGRYKSFVIDTDTYFDGALKYIERNPVRAGLAPKAEHWQWGSAYHRIYATKYAKLINADLPADLPTDYAAWINVATSPSEIDAQRLRMNRNKEAGSIVPGTETLESFSINGA